MSDREGNISINLIHYDLVVAYMIALYVTMVRKQDGSSNQCTCDFITEKCLKPLEADYYAAPAYTTAL